MGMSASQARFLCLTARKNNVEFEGQQINQQRTTLSNQSASYYAELCNMVVPTPPSVDDFTKVTYTFNDGALNNTITTMIAKPNNKYSISFIQQWQDDYSIVAAASSIIAQESDGATPPNYTYKIGSSELRELKQVDGYNAAAISGMTGLQFEQWRAAATDPYLKGLTQEQVAEVLEQEEYFQTMLNEKIGATGTNPDWYVRYVKDTTTGNYVPSFYQKSQVDSANYTNGYATSGIDCYTIGSATKTKEVINALGTVEKDTTGRYVSVLLYQTGTETVNIGGVDKEITYYLGTNGEKLNENFEAYDVDANGLLDVSSGDVHVTNTGVYLSALFTEYPLVTNTTTDEAAYNDAMNNYNYEQFKYDQKIQDINSKIEIIQQQDKSLELELKQLDTEEQAINTEMESVRKVVSKNIDSSFKTFNA